MSTITEPHSTCITCGVDLETPEAADDHRRENVFENGMSHTTRVVNPTPEERSRRRVMWEVEDALNEFCESVDRLVEHGVVTEESVKVALRGLPDFGDAWDNWLEESQ